MSKHTPGPWQRDGLSISAPQRGVVARCPTVKNGGVFDCSDNAHLIAAAPDLLEALKECLPDLEHYASTHGPGPDRRLEQARAAIAKARGQHAEEASK